MKSHKDLSVWQGSIEFITDIYKITKEFPPGRSIWPAKPDAAISDFHPGKYL